MNIGVGETTEDGLFSLEEARCLGTCSLAPVLMVNGRIHAHVKPGEIPAILESCRNQDPLNAQSSA